MAAADRTATNFLMVNSPYFVNCSECQVCRGGHCPYSARCVPGPSSFTNSGLPSLFHQVHVPSPTLSKTKLPLHRTSPVQGQIKQICGATLLAVHSIKTRPLRREPTFPCSITGAPGTGYWERGPFPHALREPLCLPALYPLPSVGDSL